MFLPNLDGHLVLVTGASRGIGAAVAEALARCPGLAGMILMARDGNRLETVAARCRAAAAPSLMIIAKAVDLGGREGGAAFDVAVREAEAQIGQGPISLAVLNAGQMRPHALAAAGGADIGPLDEVLDLNLRNIMAQTQILLAGMTDKHQNFGRIIFISSLIATTIQYQRSAGQSAYAASKAGLAAFAQSLQAEVSHLGIRATSVYPGLVRSDMGDEFIDELRPTLLDEVTLLTPEDVAQSVLLAASPLSGTACVKEISLQPQVTFDKDAAVMKAELDERLRKIIGASASGSSVKESQVELKQHATCAHPLALVTGASKGIGRAMSLRLCKLGYDLAVLARSKAELQELKAECEVVRQGCQVTLLPVDLQDQNGVADAFERLMNSHEATDLALVVLNAGVSRRVAVGVDHNEHWRKVLDVNLVCSVHLAQLTMPCLLRHAHAFPAHGAHMVFINTFVAHPLCGGFPGISPYQTSKAGLRAFADSARADVGDFGVKVSTIFPEMVDTALGNATSPLERALGRGDSGAQASSQMMTPEDVVLVLEWILKSASPSSCPSEIHLGQFVPYMPSARKVLKLFAEKHRLGMPPISVEARL